MAGLKVLTCGGGCAGPSLAFWLSRNGHSVTIVERFPALRASGAQIDLRAQGIQVVKRMGLLPAVREILVDEAGVSLVNGRNQAWATLMANKSGKGAQGPTSEYEIMRGDLVRLLHRETEGGVDYVFGKTVESFEQDDSGVTVRFSDGRTDRYDVLVGADGQSSRVRAAILPPNAPDPLHRFGLSMAYWFVPRAEIDNNIRKTYHAPGNRIAMCRSHSATETQAYFILREDSDEIRGVHKAPRERQQAFWAERFRDAGWQTDRFVAGMKDSEFFYSQEVAQVRIGGAWSKGRVVLLADAAHCPSPISGMGTTSALVGAYVLAGEMCRHSDDLERAFSNYERTLRPFVDEVQMINPIFFRFAIHETWLGILLLHLFVWLVCFLRVPELMSRFSREEKGGWMLPDYPELKSKVTDQ